MRFLIMRFSSQTRFNKELYEISAVLNYAIVQQLAFFAFVCITQLFLALRYVVNKHDRQIIQSMGDKKIRFQSFLFEANMHSKFNSA